MNGSVDWNCANDSSLVSGSAFKYHARASNRTGSFCCLAIPKRKIQERQAHLSEESAIKAPVGGCFQILDFLNLSISITCVYYGEIATGLSGRCCFRLHLPGAHLSLHPQLRKGRDTGKQRGGG